MTCDCLSNFSTQSSQVIGQVLKLLLLEDAIAAESCLRFAGPIACSFSLALLPTHLEATLYSGLGRHPLLELLVVHPLCRRNWYDNRRWCDDRIGNLNSVTVVPVLQYPNLPVIGYT